MALIGVQREAGKCMLFSQINRFSSNSMRVHACVHLNSSLSWRAQGTEQEEEEEEEVLMNCFLEDTKKLPGKKSASRPSKKALL